MRRKRYDNKELMTLAGSKTGAYDPEDPSQWRFVLEHGAPNDQTVAWVKSKTTHMSRSPFCVSERGTALWIQHLAADMGWKQQTARNVLNAVEKEGRIRLDHEHKRIWYVAGFEVQPAADSPKAKTDSNSVQSYVGPQVYEFIKSLPAEERKIREKQALTCKAWEEAMLADLMRSGRGIAERVKDTMFAGWGAKKKRIKKRAPQTPQMFQLKLMAAPEFVQSYDPEVAAELVQSMEPTLHGAKNGSHKPPAAAASLLSSDTDTDLKRSVGRSVVESSPEQDRPTDPIPFPSNLKPEDARVESIERLVTDKLGHLHDIPQRSLSLQVIGDMKGAPLEHLRAYLTPARIRKATSLGILRDYAQAVGRAWLAGEGARQRAADAQAASDAHAHQEARRGAQELLDDPRAGPEDKQLARQILGIDTKAAGGDG
jgi:hypothetical protein